MRTTGTHKDKRKLACLSPPSISSCGVTFGRSGYLICHHATWILAQDKGKLREEKGWEVKESRANSKRSRWMGSSLCELPQRQAEHQKTWLLHHNYLPDLAQMSFVDNPNPEQNREANSGKHIVRQLSWDSTNLPQAPPCRLGIRMYLF